MLREQLIGLVPERVANSWGRPEVTDDDDMPALAELVSAPGNLTEKLDRFQVRKVRKATAAEQDPDVLRAVIAAAPHQKIKAAGYGNSNLRYEDLQAFNDRWGESSRAWMAVMTSRSPLDAPVLKDDEFRSGYKNLRARIDAGKAVPGDCAAVTGRWNIAGVPVDHPELVKLLNTALAGRDWHGGSKRVRFTGASPKLTEHILSSPATFPGFTGEYMTDLTLPAPRSEWIAGKLVNHADVIIPEAWVGMVTLPDPRFTIDGAATPGLGRMAVPLWNMTVDNLELLASWSGGQIDEQHTATFGVPEGDSLEGVLLRFLEQSSSPHKLAVTAAFCSVPSYHWGNLRGIRDRVGQIIIDELMAGTPMEDLPLDRELMGHIAPALLALKWVPGTEKEGSMLGSAIDSLSLGSMLHVLLRDDPRYLWVILATDLAYLGGFTYSFAITMLEAEKVLNCSKSVADVIASAESAGFTASTAGTVEQERFTELMVGSTQRGLCTKYLAERAPKALQVQALRQGKCSNMATAAWTMPEVVAEVLTLRLGDNVTHWDLATHMLDDWTAGLDELCDLVESLG